MHHRIEHVMGMPAVIDVHDPWVSAAAVDGAFDWLRRVDALFSTYRPDSEISRLNRGELDHDRLSPLVRRMLDRCEQLRGRTGGYFDAWSAAAWDARIAPGADGVRPVEPAGLVKGWAVDGAAEILEQAGARNYCVEAAGDMRLCGVPGDATHWRVGIRHPTVADALAVVLQCDGPAAIATSATYARGEHIVDPLTAQAPTGLVSVTVVGEGDLATADAYATAIFAMGAGGPEWAALNIAPYEALMIDDTGTVISTRGLARWRAPE